MDTSREWRQRLLVLSGQDKHFAAVVGSGDVMVSHRIVTRRLGQGPGKLMLAVGSFVIGNVWGWVFRFGNWVSPCVGAPESPYPLMSVCSCCPGSARVAVWGVVVSPSVSPGLCP
jgi:hypothetical protein